MILGRFIPGPKNFQGYRHFSNKIDLVKHLVIKTSEKNCAQRFDDSMSSFLLEVSKHHIEVMTFRFERLLSGRQVERTIKHGLE